MSATKKPLGDPLARAATLGKIGARSEPVTPPTRDVSMSNPSTTQQPGLLNTQQSRGPESVLDREVAVVPTRAARKQQTVYLPPALIKRLKLYAVETDQEMSDVVAEALERFLRGE